MVHKNTLTLVSAALCSAFNIVLIVFIAFTYDGLAKVRPYPLENSLITADVGLFGQNMTNISTKDNVKESFFDKSSSICTTQFCIDNLSAFQTVLYGGIAISAVVLLANIYAVIVNLILIGNVKLSKILDLIIYVLAIVAGALMPVYFHFFWLEKYPFPKSTMSLVFFFYGSIALPVFALVGMLAYLIATFKTEKKIQIEESSGFKGDSDKSGNKESNKDEKEEPEAEKEKKPSKSSDEKKEKSEAEKEKEPSKSLDEKKEKSEAEKEKEPSKSLDEKKEKSEAEKEKEPSKDLAETKEEVKDTNEKNNKDQ